MAVSVIQILHSLEFCEPSFRTLSNITLCRKPNGSLIYSVGNSAILFKAIHGDNCIALKCYITTNPYLYEIYGDRYKPRELHIPTETFGCEWVDIVVERWIEGVSLSKYIETAAQNNDRDALRAISRSFDALALELLDSEGAHGDITCDNIIVDECGALHLIDFDASFLPTLAGLPSAELGTLAFQHPKRDEKYFDRTIDDYSLALISTALSAIAIEPDLVTRYSHEDGLLYNPSKIIAGLSEPFETSLALFARSAAIFEYAVASQLTSLTPSLADLQQLLHYKVNGIRHRNTPATLFMRYGKCGFLDQSGQEVLPPIFDDALSFRHGVAAIKLGSFWHYIDEKGEVIFNGSKYLALKSIRNGVGRALTNEGWVEIPISTLRQVYFEK